MNPDPSGAASARDLPACEICGDKTTFREAIRVMGCATQCDCGRGEEDRYIYVCRRCSQEVHAP